MTRFRALPDQQTLQRLLDYDPETGALTWRHRPKEMFSAGRNSASWSQRKWNTRYAGQPAFVGIDSEGYQSGSLFHRKRRAHRVIWKWMTGEDAEIVDHENGIRSDNRWANLCSTDDTGNARNSAHRRTNTSGHIGVSLNRRQQKWVAYIKHDGQVRHLGTFKTFEAAAVARRCAQIEAGYHPNHGLRAAR